MIILEFETGVRVAVVTGNFESTDWDRKSEGVWWQDFPFKNRDRCSIMKQI